MIIINKGATTQLIMTLTENITLSNPFFLFEFRSDVSMSKVFFILPNVSLHTDRYDEFTFIEGTTATLNPTGQWSYRVFEQASSTNLNVDLAGNLLENGQIRVVGTSVSYIENSNQDNIFIVNE